MRVLIYEQTYENAATKMELTLDQALQKGIEAHKAGKVQEADRYYTAILKANPKHTDANHNMGVLAVGIGKAQEALPFFKVALEENPKIAQYWLSYINVLISLDRIDEANAAFDQAKSKGTKGEDFEKLEQLISSSNSETSKDQEPPQEQLQRLITLHTNGMFQEVQTHAAQLLKKFPKSTKLYYLIGATNQSLGNFEEAIKAYKKALTIKPDYAEVYNNIGIALQAQGKSEGAIHAFTKAFSIKNDYAEAFNNIGVVFQEQGRLEDSVQALRESLSIKPKNADAYNNLGNTLTKQGKLKQASEAYEKALSVKPDYAEVYWNFAVLSENITEAKKRIEKCLNLDSSHLRAKLVKCALAFYAGNKHDFNTLIKSSQKDHPYTRSFSWVFSLPKLPQLHFNRWALFDDIIEQSDKKRPFYEFGVWRGEAFRYLIKTFKKGYGFDTFEGLPEAWHNEKAGSYSSGGNVPKIDGGEFIVGKFEDTLPGFFAEERPMASIVNFDADLYSSTICALNFAKPVIDKHTILIFDEFIMNKNWEEDEYKAIEEFCSNNDYTYEVLAISFFTKQVALKLVGF